MIRLVGLASLSIVFFGPAFVNAASEPKVDSLVTSRRNAGDAVYHGNGAIQSEIRRSPPAEGGYYGGIKVSAQAKPAKKHPGLSLAEFINKVIVEGEDNSLGPNISRVLGLEPDHKSRVLEKLADDGVDNRDRTVDIVVEKVPELDRLKPVCVLLMAKKTRPGAAEIDYFRLKPDGSIEKAFRSSGKLTPEGRGIPGSAVNVDFDDDEAKALLKRELDFWLRGIGLKKKPAEPAKAQAPAEGAASGKP